MDEIRDVVGSIVRGCSKVGVEVPEILAAFIARTVVESDASSFSLDHSMAKEKVEEVIIRSIDRLLLRDDPSLETMKMQVEYDASFLRNDTEAQKILRLRNKMVASHKMAIVEVEMEDANDFEALTTLYRKIFRFLLDFAPNAKAQDRQVEREVAAALESVFPRIGLKAFVQLSYDDKSAQLLELARIVLGIRLFNRDQGRGGVGIDNMEKTSLQLANAMAQDMDREVDYFTDACAKYQKAIVGAHLQKRRQLINAANEIKRIAEEKERLLSDTKADMEDEDDLGAPVKVAEAKLTKTDTSVIPIEALVPEHVIDRWSKELSNRRQYLGFLRGLHDEVRSIQDKITQQCDNIRLELGNLKSLVGSKSSVPKEVVYPRFDSLGSLWVQLYEETVIFTARSQTFRSLLKYRLSFSPTLSERFYTDKTEEQSLVELSAPSDVADAKESVGLDMAAKPHAESKGGGAGAKAGLPDDGVDGVGTAGHSEELASSSSGATLLSVHNTPDFMLLPLEMQGFCPWTIVHAKGLLIPGKPALGVIRFENMYYVCDHEPGVHAFIANPRYYLDQIRERALCNPEYIHLLRLQRWFPKASIARLLDQNDGEQQAFGGKPATRDASTGTPTHFVESHIDNDYHWNEWELRRRALKVVNLRNCATTSQQTDSSHFRRDNETQVYEQRIKETQTRREKGTNPPVITTYMSGLRGHRAPDAVAVSKYVKPTSDKADFKAQAKEMQEERYAARVVTLKLDL